MNDNIKPIGIKSKELELAKDRMADILSISQRLLKDIEILYGNDEAREYFLVQAQIIGEAMEKMSVCIYEQDRYFPFNLHI